MELGRVKDKCCGEGKDKFKAEKKWYNYGGKAKVESEIDG